MKKTDSDDKENVKPTRFKEVMMDNPLTNRPPSSSSNRIWPRDYRFLIRTDKMVTAKTFNEVLQRNQRDQLGEIRKNILSRDIHDLKWLWLEAIRDDRKYLVQFIWHSIAPLEMEFSRMLITWVIKYPPSISFSDPNQTTGSESSSNKAVEEMISRLVMYFQGVDKNNRQSLQSYFNGLYHVLRLSMRKRDTKQEKCVKFNDEKKKWEIDRNKQLRYLLQDDYDIFLFELKNKVNKSESVYWKYYKMFNPDILKYKTNRKTSYFKLHFIDKLLLDKKFDEKEKENANEMEDDMERQFFLDCMRPVDSYDIKSLLLTLDSESIFMLFYSDRMHYPIMKLLKWAKVKGLKTDEQLNHYKMRKYEKKLRYSQYDGKELSEISSDEQHYLFFDIFFKKISSSILKYDRIRQIKKVIHKLRYAVTLQENIEQRIQSNLRQDEIDGDDDQKVGNKRKREVLKPVLFKRKTINQLVDELKVYFNASIEMLFNADKNNMKMFFYILLRKLFKKGGKLNYYNEAKKKTKAILRLFFLYYPNLAKVLKAVGASISDIKNMSMFANPKTAYDQLNLEIVYDDMSFDDAVKENGYITGYEFPDMFETFFFVVKKSFKKLYSRSKPTIDAQSIAHEDKKSVDINTIQSKMVEHHFLIDKKFGGGKKSKSKKKGKSSSRKKKDKKKGKKGKKKKDKKKSKRKEKKSKKEKKDKKKDKKDREKAKKDEKKMKKKDEKQPKKGAEAASAAGSASASSSSDGPMSSSSDGSVSSNSDEGYNTSSEGLTSTDTGSSSGFTDNSSSTDSNDDSRDIDTTSRSSSSSNY